MNSGISYTKSASNWWFGAQVSDKNAPALMDIIVEELGKVKAGDIDQIDIDSTKQYAIGRFQRSAQTVGGTAAVYAPRFFFEGVVEDYYRIPVRIRSVSKQGIIAAVNAMFADRIWGFGVLGNCGETFAHELRQELAPLWPSGK